jgi:hypothetical protein
VIPQRLRSGVKLLTGVRRRERNGSLYPMELLDMLGRAGEQHPRNREIRGV